MILITILKILVVIGFLLYFLRRPSVISAIGLLTVTTAVLLDTVLGTFDREVVLGQLGFFFYVISGFLLAGAAIWIGAVSRPLWGEQLYLRHAITEPKAAPLATRQFTPLVDEMNDTPIDRQMLYEEIRKRLGFDDLFDLMFDLEIYENDIMTLPQDTTELIVNIMDYCEMRGLNHQLALAVERIITPPPPDHMPRLEKITSDALPTILRHFLLANYSFADLQRIAEVLAIDWEQLDRHNKKSFVRNLLLHLQRRNETPRLIEVMHNVVTPES